MERIYFSHDTVSSLTLVMEFPVLHGSTFSDGALDQKSKGRNRVELKRGL